MSTETPVSDLREHLAAIEPRYRLGAAISHAVPFGSAYGAMVQLWGIFGDRPASAEKTARFHLANFPRQAVTQAQAVAAILAALGGIDHDASDSQIGAAGRYVSVILGHPDGNDPDPKENER